jgi:transmembrane sensor
LREVRLQDGSLASVAPGSAIEIAYSEDERRVRLLRGAALFDVTRDAARPFRVEAAETTTHVLGTAFEVALPETSAEVTVAVVRGVVRVGKQALTETLTAGQGLRVAAHGKVTREHTSPERIAAWRTGRMEVEDASVADVVAALRPWYTGKILLASDRLGKARVTGVYNLRDAASALAALAQAHGGRARQVTPWLIILSEF